MNDDFRRARDAIATLELTGPNRDVAGQWLSFWKDGKPPPLATWRRLTWLHTEAIMICRIKKGEGILCLSAGPYFTIALNNDLTGQDTLALVPPQERDMVMSYWWQVAEGAMSVTYREFKPRDTAPAFAQNVGLPFSGEEPDGARHALLHTNWRPSGSSWIAGNVEGGLVATVRRLVRFQGPD